MTSHNFSVSDNSPKERPEKYTIIQCFSFQFNCLITNSLIVFLKEGKTRNTSLVQTNKHSCLSIKCFQQSAFTSICKPIGFCHCGLSPEQWKNSLHPLHTAICENRHYSHSVSKAALDKGKKNICFTYPYLWHSVTSEARYLKGCRRNHSNFFKEANTVSLWTRESKLHWSPIKNEDSISQLLTSSSYLTWMPVILTCTFFITWVASFSKKVSFFSSFGLARTRIF